MLNIFLYIGAMAKFWPMYGHGKEWEKTLSTILHSSRDRGRGGHVNLIFSPNIYRLHGICAKLWDMFYHFVCFVTLVIQVGDRPNFG